MPALWSASGASFFLKHTAKTLSLHHLNFLSTALLLPPNNRCLMQLSQITAGLEGRRVLFLFPFLFFSVVRGWSDFTEHRTVFTKDQCSPLLSECDALEVNNKAGRHSPLEGSKGICFSPVDNRAPRHLLEFTKHLKCKFKKCTNSEQSQRHSVRAKMSHWLQIFVHPTIQKLKSC